MKVTWKKLVPWRDFIGAGLVIAIIPALMAVTAVAIGFAK